MTQMLLTWIAQGALRAFPSSTQTFTLHAGAGGKIVAGRLDTVDTICKNLREITHRIKPIQC